MRVALFIIPLLLLAACQQYVVGGNETVNLAPELPIEKAYVVTRTEGDLVVLAPRAYDPDGDQVTYSFEKPFDRFGRWQTTFGDAGDYPILVTATDTKGASTQETVTVIIHQMNRAPILTCPKHLAAKEGETVRILCTASDDEDVTLRYEGFMVNQSYTTTFFDEGVHEVVVVATDALGLETSVLVLVTVQNVNQAPSFPSERVSMLTGEEGDVLSLETGDVFDPDGDRILITFSKPFDQAGIWRTGPRDAGTYPAEIVASDGKLSATAKVLVTVLPRNTAPVLSRIPDVRVSEGDTVKLSLSGKDRENDTLSFAVTGWMDSARYETTYDDAGEHTVKVTVSDGEFSDSEIVHITILDANRPPVFHLPG